MVRLFSGVFARASRGVLAGMLAGSLATTAAAQDYIFPTSAADYGTFYPTAYKDHAGSDWACGNIRYSGHRGSDYGAGSFAGMDAGRDIVAAASGTVTARNDGEFDRCTTADCPGGGGFGNYVYIQHANGRTTVYGHLKNGSVLPTVGQFVSCGQKIGEMGSSGHSTGPHVHFQVNNSGNVAEDPFDGPCSAPPSYWVSQGAHGGLPSRSCPNPPTCHPVGTLSCNQSFAASNNGAGSQTLIADYGCSPFQNTGAETSWTFSTPVSESVTVRVTGLTADLDLFVTSDSSCDGGDCVGGSWEGTTSDESVTFNATANHVYTVVVDGFAGAVSGFTLSAQCTGGVPPVPAYRAEFLGLSGYPSNDGVWTLQPGQVVSGTATLRNTGSATWGAGVVKIATTGPRDRTSALRAASWLSGNRAAGAGAVAPGATVSVPLSFQAPGGAGQWRESFGLVAEGVTWFADAGGPADSMLVVDVTVVEPPDPDTELPDPDTEVEPDTSVEPDTDRDTAPEPDTDSDTEPGTDVDVSEFLPIGRCACASQTYGGLALWPLLGVGLALRRRRRSA